MGEFLHAVIIKNTDKEKAKKALDELMENGNPYDIVPAECYYTESDKGVVVVLNFDCFQYKEIPVSLSVKLDTPVMLLHIQDGDFWDYALFDKGELIDLFFPMMDEFADMGESDMPSARGDVQILAKYFDVNPKDVEKYLLPWSADLWGELAYEDDECGYGAWQLNDFTRKLGFPFQWEFPEFME